MSIYSKFKKLAVCNTSRLQATWRGLLDVGKTLALRWWLWRNYDSEAQLDEQSNPTNKVHRIPSDAVILHARDLALLDDEPEWVKAKVREISWYETESTTQLISLLQEQLSQESAHPWGRFNIFTIYCALLRKDAKKQLVSRLDDNQCSGLALVLCSVVDCVETADAA